jgi:hypothetical protein
VKDEGKDEIEDARKHDPTVSVLEAVDGHVSVPVEVERG